MFTITSYPSILAFDLDGTLLRSDGTMSARTLSAACVCAAQGFEIIIATARPPRSVRVMLPDGFPPAPWVCYNGAEIHEHGKRIFQDPIPPPCADAIIRRLEALSPETTISVEIDDHLYANAPLSGPLTGPFAHTVVNLHSVLEKPAACILFDATGLDLADLQAELDGRARLLIAQIGQGALCNVVNWGVSKARALQVLLSKQGRTLQDVMAFGDSELDAEMLRESCIGVAVGNAHPAAKAAADYVTGTNDEDGVAEVLESLLKSTYQQERA